MARRNVSQEEEEAPGAPEWMVTFSDCMTLLLTFFVLLLSFSSFDNKEFSKLQVVFSNALDSIAPLPHNSRNSVSDFTPIKYTEENNDGSEKPTDSINKNEGLLKEQLSSDLNDGIVLLLPSDKMFLGEGIILSTKGKTKLKDIAKYLAEMPNRVVISERGSVNETNTETIRLERAWMIMNHLVSKEGIDRDRLSISISGTTTNKDSDSGQANSGRQVEISLLQRSVYN